jgi:hypothetical protein
MSGTWSFTSRENVGSGRSRIGCCGRYLGLRWRKYQEARENYITKRFMICTTLQILSVIKSRRTRWEGHVACTRDKTKI